MQAEANTIRCWIGALVIVGCHRDPAPPGVSISPVSRPSASAPIPPPSSDPSATAAPPTTSVPTSILAHWVSLKLEDGSTVDLRAARPRETLARVGDTTMTISRAGQSSTITGFQSIFGEMEKLVARAGDHESTDVVAEQLPKNGTVVAFTMTIGTRSGEDIRDSFLQTAVWTVAPGSPTPSKLWSGDGGEYHAYFDACMFAAEMSYALDGRGVLTRRCQPIATRNPDAKNFPDCARSPVTHCSEGVLETLAGRAR